MHYFTVDCDTFSNDEKFAVEVEVTFSEAMFSSKSMYFVGIVSDEKTEKVSTRLIGWQYSRWMSI